ncbi:MAG: polyprenyl synthetase family protein [Bacteroidales bacterium]|nr:polyprenyl synthetase family protein [Bacteroidales bacterium]
MNAINKYSEQIDRAIKDIMIPDNPAGLYEPIRYTINSKGKRLRPVITLMGCDLFDGQISRALPAAIGMEIFHNFTLLHDDIMDKSPMRRGQPSVYKKWGINSAILSGDTMFVYANEQICKTDQRYLKQVIDIFNMVARKVCEGQQYDMDFENNQEVSIADYIRMIRLKTAILIAGSLKIGAVIAGASESDQEKIFQFGEFIGIAFQFQDDYLDAFGKEDVVGKKLGNDIITNKKTYLYLKAMEIATGNTRKTLEQTYLSNNEDPEQKVNVVRKIFKQLEIDKLAREEMNKYFHLANKNLEEIGVADERKSDLRNFARKLEDRNH